MSANHLPLPPLGLNPSTAAQGTTPGSFATRPAIEPGVAGAKTFASPDTPGMPAPSDKTAWDFLPDDWMTIEDSPFDGMPILGHVETIFKQSNGVNRNVVYPRDFKP